MAELPAELNRLAGTTGLDAAGAANAWAGTTGLELVGALNAKAGTAGLGINAVIELILGTSFGRDAAGALTAAAANLLTANESDVETSVAGWQAGANLTLARSTAQALDGAASLSLTSVAAGDMTAITVRVGRTGVPIAPGRSCNLSAYFRAATTGRSCRVEIRWYTSAGATVSTSTGTSVADVTTGWTQAAVVAVAPATAYYAAPILRVIGPAAGAEVHYADRIVFV